MSWMQRLYETYERCAGKELQGDAPLMPIAHTMQQAQIEVVIDGEGNFRRASVITDKTKTYTLIPCTEESGGKAGIKPTSHPLCDKLQYLAGDYLKFGGEVTSGFASDPVEPHRQFIQLLAGWRAASVANQRLLAIVSYVQRNRLIEDLVACGVLPVDADEKLVKLWTQESDQPDIFKVIQKGQAPENAFVRWRVELAPGEAISGTWEDRTMIDSWVEYYKTIQSKRGLCMVTGQETVLAVQHPSKLRHGGDKAKLISSNDTSGFTFRGRFMEADEAAAVSFEVTQKAHNALRWLVTNQAYRNGDQVFVCWAISGKPIPNPFNDTRSLFEEIDPNDQEMINQDTAQAFALALARAIAGYGARLDVTENIVLMGLDSATPGRMGITFYRELMGSEFLNRLESWHRNLAWSQNYGKESKFLGAPAPRDIADAAFGRAAEGKQGEKLRKSTIERLLPCIVDGRPLPIDLITSTVRRAANRVGLDNWEWEKCLGIACALFKGRYTERGYKMALEQDRTSRDYLYGRLLAIAENIESFALSMASETRGTNAARLMQRFADRPFSTWRTIELSLRPSIARLRSGDRSRGFLVLRERLLDEVTGLFEGKSFTDDTRLTGEFLLGYHCQREALRRGKNAAEEASQIPTNAIELQETA